MSVSNIVPANPATDVTESYIGGANPATSPKTLTNSIHVDTITLNIPYVLCQTEKRVLDYLLTIGLTPLSQHDNEYKHESLFSLGERAKLKVTNFYGQKALKLTFYGLYQYSDTLTPLNALKTALNIIGQILKEFGSNVKESYIGGANISIAHIDLCYDLYAPIETVIPLDTFADYLQTHYQEPILYKEQNVLTGIKAGNKDTRFKFTIYDKIEKENIQTSSNLTRIEKRFREKHLKPVPIDTLAVLLSYIDLLKYEFREELIALDELFKQANLPQ